MTKQIQGKLNQLESNLPEGLLVDAAWLSQKGYSTSLRSQYVASGWLDRPVRQVYRRPRGSLRWQQVVISLQTLLGRALVVGGRTALELQGFAHYLQHDIKEVHLFGPEPPPRWLHKLPVGVRFLYHNDQRLFSNDSPLWPPPDLSTIGGPPGFHRADDVIAQPWGQWEWPMVLSAPERAVLELLDELPQGESFHQVDKLFEGLASLNPRRLQKLLAACRSVKVKRLFFFFFDR